jgi:transposase
LPTLFTLRAAARWIAVLIMSKSSTRGLRSSKRVLRERPVVCPDAAGIDLGATVHFVAVAPERDAQPVRNFGTDTASLQALADWLIACRITTVAMEATGVYWVPLFQVLEDRGLQVCLVNARHVKNVPGRKTDVLDCQWLQYLHAVGLLNASFRPPAAVCAVRSLVRHRESLVRTGCEHLLRVQKALDQMNVQLHHVVSDITGETGLAILDAIVAGERDPAVLARHRNYRCKKSQADIARALHGDWKAEHLFTLRQSLEAWRYHQKLVTECVAELDTHMRGLADQTQAEPPAPAKRSTQPDEPLRRMLFAKFGVDLTAVDGVAAQTALVFLSEVGPDVSKFATAEHFASWLGLCPDNRVSGGRKLAVGTRAVANRLATALRMAAQSLHRTESALGEWFRRLRAKLGTAAAVTATAHKLARVLYAMVKHRRAFDPNRLGNPQLRRQRKERVLRRQAEALGFSLQPIQNGAVS